MKDPITLDHLRTLVEKANNGKPSQVYLCWNHDGEYLVTTIDLCQGAELDAGLKLRGINHDWRRQVYTTAPREAHLHGVFTSAYIPASYLYDNYWYAFAQMLQLNAEKVS